MTEKPKYPDADNTGGSATKEHARDRKTPFPATDSCWEKSVKKAKKTLSPTRYGDWEKKGRCIDF